ncbi:AraC family transcriptional regulator [Niallia alba]|uniref:AraC family transcriptional regulator n=1 Tax=Niallia alba TaxID=2729105 RepID=UPI002E221030|nr:AraC family transcriptional regulator [Niallia alba]
MNLSSYLAGKKTLNEYVHQISQRGATFQVHYWGVMPRHYDNQLHKHSFFEVCYVVAGEGVYIDNNCSYLLQENTLFLSKPEVPHQIKSEKGLSLLYVAFELIESDSTECWIEMMEKAKTSSHVYLHDKEEMEIALLWKTLLIHATRQDNEWLEKYLSNMAFLLIESILQYFVPSFPKNDSKPEYEMSSELLTEAQLYINDNLANSLKLTDVARHLHISGRHLSRLFVSELGLSFSKYVQNERIKKAIYLLKKSNLSIKEISDETGFINVHYFTRVFSLTMQTSPGRFRSLFIAKNTTTFSDR